MAKKPQSNSPRTPAELRTLAETRLKQNNLSTGVSTLCTEFTQEEMLRLLHEIEVYHVELEIQQEELVHTRLELEESLGMYTELYDFAPTGYMTLSRDSKIQQANHVAARLLGVDRSLLLGMQLKQFAVPSDCRVIDALLESVFSERVPGSCEVKLLADDSRVIVRLDAAISDAFHRCRVILTDITEYKKTESELQRMTRALMATNSCNQLLIHSTDEMELLRNICSIMIDIGGYRLAWVGYRVHDKAKTIRPVAQAGFDDGYISSARITWADAPLGNGPTGTAIRTGEPCIIGDICQEPKFKPLLSQAMERGYASVQSLPLKMGGEVFGAMTIYSDIPYAFTAKDTEYHIALVDNVAYGITMLRNKKAKEYAEEEVKLSNTRLLQALEAAKAGVWEWDLNTNENFWSDELWPLYGLQQRDEKPSFKLWADTIVPDDRERVIKAVSTAAEQQKELDIEYRVCYPDGTVRWLMSRGKPLLYHEGKAYRYIGTVLDITERKHAENRLVTLSSAVEQSSASVIITDQSANIEYVNDRFTTLTGYSPEEVIGKTPAILESDKTPQEVYDNLWQTVMAGEVWKGELFIKKKNGEAYCEYIVISSVRNKDGQVTNILSVGEDITERKLAEHELKKSEERFRAMFEKHSAIQFIVDPESGRIIDANQAAADFYGWSVEELRTMSIHQINPLTHDELLGEMQKGILTGVNQFMFKHRKREGSLRDVEVFSNPIIIDGKKLFYSIIHDVTDRILAAEESDRLKSAFLANISHEIRTPMNGIMGFSELLKDPHLSGDEQAEYLGLIQQSGDRMLALINDLMDISKIDAREVKLDITETPLNQLLSDLLAFFRLEADKKGLRITLTKALPDEQSIINTDSLKLNQIMTNLIQNAMKFTSKGGIDFGYTLNGKMLEFYVIDSGIGIQADKKDKIFERFHQADNSLTRAHEGSGLGLSITKAFVELLGGTIHVDSVHGAGSTFSFTHPYNPSLLLQPETSALGTQHSALSFTILIAEDDAVSTLLLKRNLKGENLSILCAENGWEAVELVQHHPEINLVLMDLKMPIMSGYEATKLIKEQRPDLPIIAQSAFTGKEERQKAKEAGCDAFITKPINKSELLEKIHELVKM